VITVLQPTGAPLEEATVYYSSYPTAVLGYTDGNGLLHVTDLCGDSEVTFTKEGYVPQKHTLGDIDGQNIYMVSIEPLRKFRSPSSTKRLEGEHVTLYCEFKGTFTPYNIEWFKNSDLIWEDTSEDFSSSLTLGPLTSEHEGIYRCRGNSDYGSMYSDIGILTVKDSSEAFCPSLPQPKPVDLPKGCNINGNVLDVGTCEPTECRQEGLAPSDVYCCGAIDGYMLDIECADYTLPLYITTQCGCVQCISPPIDIIGTVIDGNSKIVLPNITCIQFRGRCYQF
jgi:hypothetical protein